MVINNHKRIKQAAKLLQDKRNILVFSGSGLDAGSGLPTFDTDDPQHIVDWGIGKWNDSEQWREAVWALRAQFLNDTEPNAGHYAIERMTAAGVATHVTSNISGLTPAIELCGSAARTTVDPATGILRPDVVFIGELLPDEPMDAYWEAAEAADAVIIVGASDLIGLWESAALFAMSNGAPVIVINPDPSKHQKKSADVVIKQRAEQALPNLVGMLNLLVQASSSGGDK